MILVTVGLHHQGFERLVSSMDIVASKIEDRVIIQYGSSSYKPQFAEGFAWCSGLEMSELIIQSNIIVTHAAAGTILTGLLQKKPLVVVPRRKIFNEHFNDHQMQIATALSDMGKVTLVIDPTWQNLVEALAKAEVSKSNLCHSDLLIDNIRDQLDHWDINR